MLAATSPFTPVAQSDEIRSTSCAEEEALRVREPPAKVRGVWKVSVVAAVTGLVAAASVWWSPSDSEVVGDKVAGLASTYVPYGTIGCINWADIEISRSQVSDKNACETLCENTPGCTTFNWQATSCEAGWPVKNGCLLFKDTCTTMRNDCWELNYKMENTETTVAQTLTVETSVGQADAEAAVVAALASAGISPVKITVTPGRRLQQLPMPLNVYVIGYYYNAVRANWVWWYFSAYAYAYELSTDPAALAAFIARCKDNLPQGSTFGVTECGEPKKPVLPGVIDFKCSDHSASIDEAESCHEEKFRVLSLEMKDLPPEVKENEGAFLKFLLANRRDYFHGYLVNVTEFKARLETFSATMKLIDERNALASESGLSNPAIHGITKFADWTPEEFEALLGGRGSEEEGRLRRLRAEGDGERETRRLEDAPGNASASCTADWSSRNEIRNQGGCGNCWTFSTAESIRSATIQQTGQDPGPLSTQYITDCMTITSCKHGVNGCCGGNPGEAMLWLDKEQKEGRGIPTREAYGDMFKPGEKLPPHKVSSTSSSSGGGPVSLNSAGLTYSGNFPFTQFECKKGIKPAVKLVLGDSLNETEARSLVKTEAEMESYVCGTGSLSIILDAKIWNTYVGGVMDPKQCGGTKIDHAVLLVGVNQEENAWLVQNSWGSDWGINTAGEPVLKNQYHNCPQVAGTDRQGCTQALKSLGGKTVADVCPYSCAENPLKGGFIWLEFGVNTCNIRDEPVRVPTVEIV